MALSTDCTSAQGTTLNWTIEGVKREALVFAPANSQKRQRHPLVFAFHGHFGNMRNNARLMKVQTEWPEAIVVYPQGLPTPSAVDPRGIGNGWQITAGQYSDRDLKLFDAMLATLKQNYSVDEHSVYAVGFSNGAIFSYLLWSERPKVLAAFGINAGRLAPPQQLTTSRPAVVIAGETDAILPFPLQQETIENVRQVDNATGKGQPCGQYCTLYQSTTHTPLVTYIHPGGHIYPTWASAQFVKFFKTHKLP